MGRGEEIRDEIELMTMLRLPDKEIAKAEALLAKINQIEQRLSGKVTLKLGVGRANNVNSWPDNGELTRGGLNYPLPDPVYQKFKPVRDTIVEGQFVLSGSYKLNDAGSVASDFSFLSKVKDGRKTASADQRYNFGNFGLRKSFVSGFSLKGGVSKGHLNRVNEHKGESLNSDLSKTGMNLDASNKITNSLTVSYRASSTKNDYSKVKSADLSDAKTNSHRVYLGAPFGQSTYLRGSLVTSKARSNLGKDTAANHVKSREWVNKHTRGISVLAFFLLPRDQRLIGTATLKRVKFKKQMVDTAKPRRDNVASVTLGYSIKGVQVWSRMDGLSLGLDASYSKTGSNQASAKIKSKTFMFSVSKSFNL